MAQIKVMGNAVVFQSSMKLEDLELVQKYRSEALSVKGGEEGKEILFTVVPATGTIGDVNDAVVMFGQKSNGGLATVTKLIPCMPDSEGELKELLADKLGAALGYMNKLEETLPAVLEEVKAERAAVMEAIEVA